MENQSPISLHVRSDGFVETPSGDFAITMLVAAGVVDGIQYFEFNAKAGGDAIKVEWSLGDKLCIFPQDISRALIAARYAATPNQAAIDWYETMEASGEIKEKLNVGGTQDDEQKPIDPPKEPAKTVEPVKEPSKEPAAVEKPAAAADKPAATETPKEPAKAAAPKAK